MLPGVASGEVKISLGYTEPDGGSDLAGARTRSMRTDDGWLINGAKMFTTGAQNCQYSMLVTRSDPDADDRGFDTTTALTAHSLEWLSENPDARTRLIDAMDTLLDPATEEFLRFFTPAQGDGRTISADCELAEPVTKRKRAAVIE